MTETSNVMMTSPTTYTSNNHDSTFWVVVGMSVMIFICPLLLLVIISAVSCVCCWKLQRSTIYRFGEHDEIQNYETPSAINLLKIEENNAYGQLELAQREHIYCN